MAYQAPAVGQDQVINEQNNATNEMRSMMIASIKFNTDMTSAQVAGNNGQRAAKAYPNG